MILTWKGLGILIPVVAASGIALGLVIDESLGNTGIGTGIGLSLAAAGNWILWNAIFPPRPVARGGSGAWQELRAARHGFFFIPARFWTWIFAVAALPVLLTGVDGVKRLALDAKKPGATEFKAADRLIDSSNHGVANGNTVGAKTLAADFSTGIREMAATRLPGTEKILKGDYLTYCRESPDTIVIICQVPSLWKIKSGDTRDALAKLAWTTGTTALAKLDPEHRKSLMIGLRDFASYRSIQVASPGKDQSPAKLDPKEKSCFYPAFAAAP